MKELTRAVIDRDAFRSNYKGFRNLVGEKCKIMAVVKADAYGHGAVEVSKVALESGCSALAVARISEAKAIRDGGITAPILLFGYCDPSYIEYMHRNRIIASIGSLENAIIINDIARSLNIRFKVHLKTDTGMGRIGGTTELRDTVNEITSIFSLSNLEIEGIYTHYANADSRDKTHALEQFDKFQTIITDLKRDGIEFKIKHSANSAATIDMPETHLDMVRPGIAQYGLYPSKDVSKKNIKLTPALSLLTTIIQIKDVPAGFKVSYGSTYVTDKPSKIAVVPIGYADGYSRLLSSKAKVLVNGHYANVIGRVCMDLTMIDISDIPGVNSGDCVTLIGCDSGKEISADYIADLRGTINYEVTSNIAPRVFKEYIN